MRIPNLVFIKGALADVRNKNLPNARSAQGTHRMIAPIPIIERPYHAHPLRIWRPDCKTGAWNTVDRSELRAQFIIDATLVALAKQVQIHFAQSRQKRISIPRAAHLP